MKRRVIALVVTGLLTLSGVAMAGNLDNPSARVGLAKPTEFQGTVADVFQTGGGCGGGGSLWAELKGSDGDFYVALGSFDPAKLAALGFNEGDSVTVVGYSDVVKDGDTEYRVVTPVALKGKDATVQPYWAEREAFRSSMMNSGMMNSGMMNSGTTNSGMMNSGMMNSGMMNSGMMNSGMMSSGMMSMMGSGSSASQGCGGSADQGSGNQEKAAPSDSAPAASDQAAPAQTSPDQAPSK